MFWFLKLSSLLRNGFALLLLSMLIFKPLLLHVFVYGLICNIGTSSWIRMNTYISIALFSIILLIMFLILVIIITNWLVTDIIMSDNVTPKIICTKNNQRWRPWATTEHVRSPAWFRKSIPTGHDRTCPVVRPVKNAIHTQTRPII